MLEGTLYNIVKAQSVLKLKQKVLETRHQLEADFDAKLKNDSSDVILLQQKESCLKQFDEANKDTMNQVADAREIFEQYPEFAGLLL